MARIEQQVRALRHDGGRHAEDRCPARDEPRVTERARLRREIGDRLDREIVEVDRQQRVVLGQQFGRQIEMDANLQHGEGGRRGGIDQRMPGAVPATAEQARAVAAKIGEGLAAETPGQHAAG